MEVKDPDDLGMKIRVGDLKEGSEYYVTTHRPEEPYRKVIVKTINKDNDPSIYYVITNPAGIYGINPKDKTPYNQFYKVELGHLTHVNKLKVGKSYLITRPWYGKVWDSKTMTKSSIPTHKDKITINEIEIFHPLVYISATDERGGKAIYPVHLDNPNFVFYEMDTPIQRAIGVVGHSMTYNPETGHAYNFGPGTFGKLIRDYVGVGEDKKTPSPKSPKSKTPKSKGGYRATARDRKYLARLQAGKSIGFTMRASLKAKGLIPRANGSTRVSEKYRTKRNGTRRLRA